MWYIYYIWLIIYYTVAGVYLLYMDNNLLGAVIVASSGIIGAVIGTIGVSLKGNKNIEKLDIKMDKDCGRLSREHDSLLIKQEKMLDKQISQESILMLLKHQMEDRRRQKDSIREDIGENLFKNVDSSIATLQILAEEVKKKNEEIKELRILINDLTEENKQLSDELKEYKHRLNNNRSYNPDREDEEELEL